MLSKELLLSPPFDAEFLMVIPIVTVLLAGLHLVMHWLVAIGQNVANRTDSKAFENIEENNHHSAI